VPVSDNPEDAAAKKVLAGILKYMIEHPEAKDSVEGIEAWWRPEREEWPAAVVRDVLASLEARNWVVVREVASGAHLYGANPGHIGDMRRHLAQLEESQDLVRRSDEWQHHR
jgi:hypothetical protein